MQANSSQGPRSSQEPNGQTNNPQPEKNQGSSQNELQSSATSQQRDQASALTQQYINENVETSNMTRQDLDNLNEDVYRQILIQLVGGGLAGEIVSSMYDLFYEAEIMSDQDEPRIEMDDSDYQALSGTSTGYSSAGGTESSLQGQSAGAPAQSIDVGSFTPGGLMRNVETSGARRIDLQTLINERNAELRKPRGQRDSSKLYIRANFLNIPMVGEGNNRRVDDQAARQILEGTPISWEDLQRISQTTVFGRYKSALRTRYLPCALTIATVLKERGFTGESFKFFFKLGLAVAQKESGCGFATYGFYDGATGITQFTRATRERMFFELPERERAQYTELNAAANQAQSMVRDRGSYYFSRRENRLIRSGKYQNQTYANYSNLLTDYMLHSPTLATRMMFNLLLKISARVSRAGVAVGTPEHARFCWLAYNIGPGRIERSIQFYQRFPNPRQNKTAALAYLTELGITNEVIRKRLIEKVGQNSKGGYLGQSYIQHTFVQLTNVLG